MVGYAWLTAASGVFALGYALVLLLVLELPGRDRASVGGHSAAGRAAVSVWLRRAQLILALVGLVGGGVLLGAVLSSRGGGVGHPLMAFAFAVGVAGSALAERLGARAAVGALGRGAASGGDVSLAARTAWIGGGVAGMTWGGMALLGLSVLFGLCVMVFRVGGQPELGRIAEVLVGFGLGSSCAAFLVCLGGGLWAHGLSARAQWPHGEEVAARDALTMGAADLSERVARGVMNTLAAGADLFQSEAVAVLACMLIGTAGLKLPERTSFVPELVFLPLVLAGAGIVASVVGHLLTGIGRVEATRTAAGTGRGVSVVLMVAFGFTLTRWVMPAQYESPGGEFGPGRVFASMLLGLAAAGLISTIASRHASRVSQYPRVANGGSAGPWELPRFGPIAASVRPTFWSAAVVCAAVALAHGLAGPYGVAVLAIGFLSMSGLRFAESAAAAIRTLAQTAAPLGAGDDLPQEGKRRAVAAAGGTREDAGGNALAGAVLSAVSVVLAYCSSVSVTVIDPSRPGSLAALVAGGLLPILVVSSLFRRAGLLAQGTPGRVAVQPPQGAREGEVPANGADDGRADSLASSALRGVRFPAFLAVAAPIAFGLANSEMLNALLMGSIASALILGFLLSHLVGCEETGAFVREVAAPSVGVLVKLMAILSLGCAVLLR